MNDVKFEYPVRGKGRPQIVLIGNGLERKSGQVAWNTLVRNLTQPNCIRLTETEMEKVPFPLLYEVLSLNEPIPKMLDEKSIEEEEERLQTQMETLVNESNDLLDELPGLGADHIFTTNYSYCLESAFFPKKTEKTGEKEKREAEESAEKKEEEKKKERKRESSFRSRHRFNLNPVDDDWKKKRETIYRLHCGYLTNKNHSPQTALWHIHGEVYPSKGIILGHDRYGRLLGRIIKACEELPFEDFKKSDARYSFTSWPALFLFADVYVIGFGFEQCEFDLWWLLKRKQREKYADGTVYFYDKKCTEKATISVDPGASEADRKASIQKNKDISWHNHNVEKNALRNKILRSHGVEIIDLGSGNDTDYDDFYRKAFKDVKAKIEASRR